MRGAVEDEPSSNSGKARSAPSRAEGVVLGTTMFAGSWAGRRLVDRLSERAFVLAIEVLLVLMGLKRLLFPG